MTTWSAKTVCLSIFLFIIAGLFEIGGGYLIWIGIKKGFKPSLTLPLGAIVLVVYGFIPTLQPIDSSDFGRVFAVYGGFFIIGSYIWGYVFDGMKVDLGDYIGCSIAIVGVLIAWFWKR